MSRLSPARLRGFVRAETVLQPVPGLPGIRLHTGTDVMALCRRAGALMGDAEPDLPYWAFPWAGGLAIARYLIDHPDAVRHRSVLDLAAGSGLCGIMALRQGAARVVAADLDPLAAAATWLNARANGVDLPCVTRDLLDEPAPRVDVILAGDVCYQATMAGRMVPWLAGAAAAGTRVLLGDPGRPYLPDGLTLLGTYDVVTSRELEDSDRKSGSVFTFGE